ncbi:MAG TPA: STM4012 family radical SAM protein, partial [Ktedonobacteraceae bacterium]|nr:STM4012 family radical SAM protein [Ktedonobacteraceae bacterium]
MPSLDEMLKSTPYVAYTYSYPHKTTYRTFPEPLPLSKIWANEQREDLSLYIHVPFCEMRCGFCNLFTTANPTESQSNDYMKSLRKQAERTREALETFTVTRLAIGGGTPTYLSVTELAELFEIGKQFFEITPASIPTSVETSPMTAQTEKLALLKEHGVDRISIGVQSFLEAEARAAGRPQKTSVVAQALENIRRLDFPTLNIDLIYGLPGQSLESWRESLEMALNYQPEELYLYPLYIRPLTGLGRKNRPGFQKEDPRLQYYRAGRDLLLSAGYTQISMRMFRANCMQKQSGPVYCTQDDGMLGLG